MRLSPIRRYHETFEDGLVRQTEWVEGRGLLLVLAMYVGSIGSAAYLLGSFLHAPAAVVTGWLLAVVGKGVLHITFLGRPERFWRALARPHGSWISRGILALSIFAVAGGLHALPSLQHLFPGFVSPLPPGAVTGLGWLAVPLAAFLLVYDGFLVRAAIGVPFWRQGLMPVLFPMFGLLAGSGILSVLSITMGIPAAMIPTLEAIDRILLVACALSLAGALKIAGRQSEAARSSVVELMRGSARWFFCGGAIVLTILLPLGTVVLSAATRIPVAVLGTISLLSVAGEFFFKYSILKAGIYEPLYPRQAAGELV